LLLSARKEIGTRRKIAIAPEDVSAFVDKLTDVIGIPNAGK